MYPNEVVMFFFVVIFSFLIFFVFNIFLNPSVKKRDIGQDNCSVHIATNLIEPYKLHRMMTPIGKGLGRRGGVLQMTAVRDGGEAGVKRSVTK